MNADLMARVFLSSSQRRLLRRGLPIFIFHKIASPPAATLDPFDYTLPEEFDAKLKALKEAGLVPVSLDTVVRGREAGPGNFVVTFDDGYRNVCDQGLEILTRHRVAAIQFLVAGLLGKRNEWDIANHDVIEPLMDESQVREWLAEGQQIGSHSLTHRNLKKLGEREAREEIAGSKKKLEDTFGIPVRHFCYPFGLYNERVSGLAQAAGYETACTVAFGINPAPLGFELKRVMPLTRRELMAKIWHRLRRKCGG
jgi:peptidoglycan/xylan/chitin deacetylase (PgdA/CDA1 family)